MFAKYAMHDGCRFEVSPPMSADNHGIACGGSSSRVLRYKYFTIFYLSQDQFSTSWRIPLAGSFRDCLHFWISVPIKSIIYQVIVQRFIGLDSIIVKVT